MKTKTYHLNNATDTERLGEKLSQKFSSGIIYLLGELGAGKTTFTRGFLRGLQYTGKVKSPTYTLVESYDLMGKQVFHFDFYRINNSDELVNTGLEEYFHQDNVCIIEWPDKALEIIPLPDMVVKFDFATPGRNVTITVYSDSEKNMLSLTGFRT